MASHSLACCRLSVIILVFSILPRVHAFSRSFFQSRAVATSQEPADHLLVDSLPKEFPITIHPHPAFSSALALLRSLESKPSCHRTATAALVNDCNSLNSKNSHHSNIKIQFAARLAVCEFEDTGISYPNECTRLDALESSDARLMKCVKSLEEKPQWWTTLSNSIQNAVVICAAVKHEVEKDDLLQLHKNITRVQDDLYKIMDASLGQARSYSEEQRVLTNSWTNMISKMKNNLRQFSDGFSASIEKADIELKGLLFGFPEEISKARKQSGRLLGDMDKLFNISSAAIQELADQATVAWRTAEEIANRNIEQYQKEFEQNRNIMRESQVEFSTAIAGSTEQFLSAIFILTSDIQASTDAAKLAHSNTHASVSLLNSLSTSYAELLRAQESLTQTLVHQGNAQRNLFESLEAVEPRLNATLEMMLLMSGRLFMILEEAENRVQQLGWTGQVWPSVAMSVLGFAMLPGRSFGKLFAALSIFYTAFVVWTKAPLLYDFTGIARQGAFRVVSQTTKNSVELLNLAAIGHPRIIFICLAGGFTIFLLLGGVTIAYRHGASANIAEKALD